MKLLFLSRRYYPHVGGVEKHLEGIFEYLKIKHHLTVVTELHDRSLPEYEVVDQVHVYRIPITTSEKEKKWEIWRWWVNHFDLLKSADIIHIQDIFFWLLPFRFLLPLKKVYMTFQGYEGGIPTKTQIFWHRLAALLTRGSISMGDFHQKWYGVKPTMVSYGGANIKFEDKTKRQGAVFVGRTNPDMGLEVCRQIAKQRKMRLVEYIGVPNAARYLSNFKYAFVSGYITIIEALQSGTPVLAYYHNEIKKDYLEMTPFRPFINIFNEPEDADFNFSVKQIQKGRDWASQQTWEKVANLYEQLWKK